MTVLEKRALYYLLRMHWLNDPTIKVENWQIEDYQQLPIETLFDRLRQMSIHLDKVSVVAYAEECESPEDLTDYLIGDRPLKAEEEDLIYLIVFELWRRLLQDKPSLSLFCNELDHLISAYDQGELTNLAILQEDMIKLLKILNENVDAGLEPKEAFERLSAYCANSLETFIYDFISEQIEEENEPYAHELIDGFALYFANNKWFDLLRAKSLAHSNPKVAQRLISQIIEDDLEAQELDFNLELLASLSEIGSPLLFRQLIKQTVSLIETEEDFQDLLMIMIDYYHRLDQENVEHAIQSMLNKRSHRAKHASWNAKDSDLNKLLEIIHI